MDPAVGQCGNRNERFSHHSKHWNFENIIVEPPTRQKPHPPIWMAAGSPDSIRKVARRGCKLLLDQLASTALAIERFNIYKAEVEACGRMFDPKPLVKSVVPNVPLTPPLALSTT